MTHDEFLNLLSARLDGELTPEQQEQIDTYLRDNDDARILLAAFESQDGELRRAFEPRRQAAAAVAERAASAISSPTLPSPFEARRRWRHRLYWAVPSLSAVAAAVIAGIFWFKQHHGPGNPTHDQAADPRGVGLKPRAVVDAQAPTRIGAGQSVTTRAGERRRVQLPDRSILYLNQETTLAVTDDRHVRLERGEVFAEVVPASGDRGRFTVETKDRTVTALGTKFAVRAAKKGTGVLVTQGKVQVSGLTEPVKAGQELNPGAKAPDAAPRASHALDWTEELMTSAESPLVPAGKYGGGALVAVDPYGQEAKLSLVKYHIDVHIEDGFARTTIDQTYFNSENFQMEGTFYFPLPPDASLSRLAMYVDGNLMEGGMAERDYARQTYERIRYAQRDPALLEWVDGSLFKMRVFPLEPRQEKRLILSYTQRLPVLYGRTTYRFPAGHSLNHVREWSFTGLVKDGARLSFRSPSHPDMKAQAHGGDLTLSDSTQNVVPNQDVVVELIDSAQSPASETVRWSSALHEGKRYLMLRYRPDLQGAPQRERRDWVFLFESSGARDPLLARAQIEVIRALLDNAEHDDTFSILTVGTRVKQFRPESIPATPENVSEAVKFLEQSHLIGALDLEQGLKEAAGLLQKAANPYLVHVGGGIATLGEQRSEMLIPRIPQNARYVGVAVGKRFSLPFMKGAAEKSGGYFTQINPDEPIAWRGFELAATLNTPRLLDARVEAMLPAGGERSNAPRFLTFSNLVTQGEEVAAVARVEDGQQLPAFAMVRGSFNGQPFERRIPFEGVNEGADYLPRTWAKLEIDRLVAFDGSKYRKDIIDLSKAMYVMTPYTSLLVLENEQMYKDFKVDRGRKDHWAMYPAPAEVPVVYIPDPNQPADSRRPDLQGQMPHANQVLQTVLVRTRPSILTGPNGSSNDSPYQTAGQFYGGAYAIPEGKDAGRLGRLLTDDLADGTSNTIALGDGSVRLMLGGYVVEDSNMGGIEFRRRERNHLDESVFGGRTRATRASLLRAAGGTSSGVTSGTEMVAEFFGYVDFDGDFFATGDLPVVGKKALRGDRLVHGFSDRTRVGEVLIMGNEVTPDAVIRRKTIWKPMSTGGVAGVAFTTGSDGEWNWKEGNDVYEFGPPLLSRTPVLFDPIAAPEEAKPALPITLPRPASRIHAILQGSTQGPRYYTRPSFTGNGRVFSDLASYAPGMSSSRADVQAVVEEEAAPRFGSKRGSIDPAARKLIDAARSAGWVQTVFPLSAEESLSVLHDGQGRYAYERRLPLGLVERVVCDGTTLLHLYPELGIGARRAVSRFHRAEFADLVPDFVPPAEDLARGADIKALDAKTVAIVPHRAATTEVSGPAAWIEERLIFDGPRIAERHWVVVSDKEPRKEPKLIGREVYEDSGAIKRFDSNDKELATEKRERHAAPAPDLKPDLRELVVLPLPLRPRGYVYPQVGFDPNASIRDNSVNGCIPYIDEDSALRLFAADFAENQGGRAFDIWYHRFAEQGDRRIGFYTLLVACGAQSTTDQHFKELLRERPGQPLLRYLALLQDSMYNRWQGLYGLLPGDDMPDSFLGRLSAFRSLSVRWQGEHVTHRILGQRPLERERALRFVRDNASNPLGWCALTFLQDRAGRDEPFLRRIADAWGVVAEKSALKYPARYEQARCLHQAGETRTAHAKFQELFVETLGNGVLPSVDSGFRYGLSYEPSVENWPNLMRQTAEQCIRKKQRPVVVALAWQCRQLGDQPLAETLLDLALKDIDQKERPETTLAAIEYLCHVGDMDQADHFVQALLKDKDLAQAPLLWRLASHIAERRGQSVEAIKYFETALDLEFPHLPEVVNLETIRGDYGRLLAHYRWLADAVRALNVAPPDDLLARTVRAADRWRMLDPEAANVCDQAASILKLVGGSQGEELAWDYLTTPLALRPNESSPWLSLAQSLAREGRSELADRCYDAAFRAEPTNAQILWDRAQQLQRIGKVSEAREQMQHLAAGDWQPRFTWIKQQARQIAEGR
jgi:ferric-dicitrate binding protein FerR (iron transport regulator)/tetratricopeptide (TPR) repeat protein